MPNRGFMAASKYVPRLLPLASILRGTTTWRTQQQLPLALESTQPSAPVAISPPPTACDGPARSLLGIQWRAGWIRVWLQSEIRLPSAHTVADLPFRVVGLGSHCEWTSCGSKALPTTQEDEMTDLEAGKQVQDSSATERRGAVVPGPSSGGNVPSLPAWLEQARAHLRDADPVLARLIDDRPNFDPQAWMAELPPMDLYGALLFQVTGQQLSVAATRRTLARIETLFGGQLPSPAELLAVDPITLRQAGLSWRKIGTLRDLAERLSDGRLNTDVLSALPDDEFISELTAVPGIGPWTAQGVLLIALGREDVVLPGDLALRKAVRGAYQLDHLPSQQEVLDIAEPWRPYRSLATSYLFSATFEPTDTSPTTRSPDADGRNVT